MKVTVEFDGCCPRGDERRPRPVFVVSRVVEQTAPPAKTRKYHRFPLPGEVDFAMQITATQQFDVSFAVTDKRGNPALVDGVPEWLTDNSDLVTITPSGDGKTCTVAANGVLGTGRVQVNLDADLGAGVVPLIGTLDVEVTPGTATVVTLTPGPVTEQP